MALILALQAACAGLQAPADGGPEEPVRIASAMPPRIELGAVPFFAQKDNHCGPVALAMVLRHGGLPVAPQDLESQVYTPARQGSLPGDMAGAARRRGRLAYLVDSFKDLLGEVAAGRPAIALLNLQVSWAPRWHYAVVMGYDLDAETVILRSGTEPRKVLPFHRFRDAWRQGGRWALAVVPPGTLSVAAGETRYLEAALGLERARQWEPAARAYEAARARWPASLGAAMGLGNARYALGELGAAAGAFETATRIHPGAAPDYNNLAQVLGELGRRDEAMGAVRRAVVLGGAHSEIYRATLAELTGGPPRQAASPGMP